MIIIHHRVNTLEALKKVPLHHGAEVDVRYHHNKLVLHHDPFHHHEDPQPISLDSFLSVYQLQGPLILNLKTEGIEDACIQLMVQHQVKQWFFLDMSMPYVVKYANDAMNQVRPGFNIDNLAVRFSEYEAIDYCLGFENKAGWVWVDYFTTYPLDKDTVNRLSQAFKLCLVSPELQGYPVTEIDRWANRLKEIPYHAVCTKYPEKWEEK